MFPDCLPDFQILQTISEPCLNSLKYNSKDFNGSTYIRRPNTASIRSSQLLKHDQRHNLKDAHQKSDAEKSSGSESGIFCSADDIETLNNEDGTVRLDDCSSTAETELLNSNRNTTSANIDNLSIYSKRAKKTPERLEAIKIMTDESQAFQIQNQDRRKLIVCGYVPDMSSKQTETNELMREGFTQGLENCKYLKKSTNPNTNCQKKAERQKTDIMCSKQNRRLYECRDIDFRFIKRSRLNASSFWGSNVENKQQNVEKTLQKKQTTLRQPESVQNFPGKGLGHVVMDERHKNIKDRYKDNETCCSHVAFNEDPSLCLSKYLNLSRESKESQHPHLNDEEKIMKDGKNMDNDDTCIKVPLRELSNSANCSRADPKRMKDLSESCQSFSMCQQHVADGQGMMTNEMRKHLKDEHQEKQMIIYRHYFHLLEKLNISKKEAELAADLQMIEKLCMGGTNHFRNISRSCSDRQTRSHDLASPKSTDERINGKDSEINSIKSLFDSNYSKLKEGFLPPKPISNRTSDPGPQLSCSNFPLQSNNTKQSYSHDNVYHKPFCYQDFSRCKCLYQESSQKEPSLNGLHTKLHTKPTSKKSQQECSDHSCRCEETLLHPLPHLQFQATKKEPKYRKHKTMKNSFGNIANSNNDVTSVLLLNSSQKDNSLESNYLNKKCQHNKENSHITCSDPNSNPNPNLTAHKSKPNLFSVRNPNDFMAAKEAADILKTLKIKSEYSSEQYFILEDPSEKETASFRQRDSFSKYAGRDLKYPHSAINKNASKDIELYETINNEPNYELISNLRLNTNVRSSNSETVQKNRNLFKKIFRKTKNTSTLYTNSI